MNSKRILLGLFILVGLFGIGWASYLHYKSTEFTDSIVLPANLPSFNPSAPTLSTGSANRLIIGTLTASSANINELPITVGTDDATLNTGMAGAYAWGSPGQPGVFAIAGHRVGAGGPFRHLDAVHIGDRITVQSEGKTFTYRVIKSEIVKPSETSVLNGPASESRIVLITCTPMNTYTDRIVVTGKLLSIQ